jgi:hypothetical protein
MIKPQVSMPVLYHPDHNDHFGAGRPLAAIITQVWGDACVNLAIFDGNGLGQNRSSVLLWRGADGECPPAGGRWCQFPDWFLRAQDAANGRFTLAASAESAFPVAPAIAIPQPVWVDTRCPVPYGIHCAVGASE